MLPHFLPGSLPFLSTPMHELTRDWERVITAYGKLPRHGTKMTKGKSNRSKGWYLRSRAFSKKCSSNGPLFAHFISFFTNTIKCYIHIQCISNASVVTLPISHRVRSKFQHKTLWLVLTQVIPLRNSVKNHHTGIFTIISWTCDMWCEVWFWCLKRESHLCSLEITLVMPNILLQSIAKMHLGSKLNVPTFRLSLRFSWFL